MNRLIELIVGSGPGKALLAVQKFLSGKKAYIAGSILLLQGLSCLIEQIVGLHGIGDLLSLLRDMHNNQCVDQIAQGLGIMGLRAGIAKGLQKGA